MLRYLLIFAVALAVRLVHVWQIRRSPFFDVLMGDARSYDEWARRIAGGDWVGSEVFYQAPLYPYFLGVIYTLAGRELLLVRIVQAVLGSLSCVLLALAGTRLFSPRVVLRPFDELRVVPSHVEGRQAQDDSEPGRRVGLIAGLALALYAPAIFFDGLIQKSVLDVLFVCVALYFIAKIVPVRLKADTTEARIRSGGVRLQPDRPWLWLGLAVGALTLTRENAIVFTAVIVIWGLLRFGVRPAAVFLLGVAIVVLPVAIRNSLVSGGGFYVTTSQFGPNFYIGNNARSDGSYQSLRYGRGAPEYERQDATELAERARGRRLTPAEVSSYWTEQALDFITGRPAEWLRLMGRKVALLVNRTEMLDTESQESHAEWSLPLRIASVVGHFGVLVPLAVVGLIGSWRDRSRIGVLYALLLAYAASVVFFYVFARYRYPLVPFLLLFSAAGMLALARVRLKPDTTDNSTGADARVRPYVLGLVAVVAIFANWPIVSADMNRAVTEHNLGAALQTDGRYDEAIAHYRRATDLRPDYAPAYNNLASTLRAKGQLREALATYEQALRLQPEYPEAHYNLANALLEAGKRDEAVAHFQRALQSMPASADVHNNLGIALMEKGKADEAVAEFRQAVQLEPGSAKAHRNLGDALTTIGAQKGAVPLLREGLDHLRRATELSPDDGSLHYDLGSALLEAGKRDEAIAALRTAVRLAPDSAEAHNNLGIALASQGKVEEARGEFQAALKLKPDFADARQNLALALGRKQ